jgi:pectin lyase
MKLFALSTFLAASTASGYAVIGTPEGFARGTTGGGSVACQVPSSTAQLKSWLEDSTARCIVLDRELVGM